jgi:hypothetical protein
LSVEMDCAPKTNIVLHMNDSAPMHSQYRVRHEILTRTSKTEKRIKWAI